jgi:nucleoporin GLE1
MMDPSSFVLEPREPRDGAAHNGELPSIFLYVVDIVAEKAIDQFKSESGVNPKTADPIGIVVASTFSDPQFHWRGLSLIDMFVARLRVVCPVLFGFNGKETTEQGRARLGWAKDDGFWVSEQDHMDRMTGYGAGFAAVSLRNFKKASKVNPYPPRHYWEAMAKIVNTPPAEISMTQCLVLKAMIQNFETRILDAYGSAGVAALRLALVEIPRKALAKGPAISSLEVHAKVIKRDWGLDLFA